MNPPIYTALSVPTVLTHPSPRCLQWSEEGQLCLVTKYAVHILTPDHGVNFSTPADIKSPIGDEQSDKPLGWYRTVIETARGQTHTWPSLSQGWGCLSLGSLDLSIRAVACSPRGLTSRGRCVLAVLNSNMEVSLWAAAKNHLKGEWLNIQDVTAYLLDLCVGKFDEMTRVLHTQATSVAWSEQLDYSVSPVPLLDASILALGSRAGAIVFFRFDRDTRSEGSVSVIHELKLGEQWITHLAWSPWYTTSMATHESLLAYGVAGGGVGLVKVSQTIQTLSVEGLVPTYTCEAAFEPLGELICEPDKRAITSLDWIAVAERNPILVYSKPGVIHLWSWSPSSSPSHWHGAKSLLIKTQNLSIGSTALSSVSGFSYVNASDILIVALFDGSLHAIHNFSVDPSWLPSFPQEHLTSAALSQICRAFFAQATPTGIDNMQVNRISGLVSYDLHSCLSWIHESARPSDFSYKHEAKHEYMLLTAPFWPLDDKTILKAAQEILVERHQETRNEPVHRLRSMFLHLCNTGRFAELCPRVLELLNQVPSDDSAGVLVPPWSQGLSELLQLQLRRSFSTHLFGWHDLRLLRLRLSVADMCWKLCKDTQMREDCGQVAQNQLNEISHRVLRILVRHHTAIIAALAPSDVPFVLRIVVQSLLPGSPLDLTSEAQALSDSVSAAITIDPTIAGLHELCPACHVEVPLQDITQATCPNGHSWARCSVTSFILSTSMVRTCIGCTRKALLPVSQVSAPDDSWLPIPARSWIVKELLEAVQRCLFCGNSFVVIV